MKNRLQQIMEREGMTPGRFADSIGIQRSALSHILNGRNNPSLDVVMKVLARFEYLSTDWLMFGNGPMFKHQLVDDADESIASDSPHDADSFGNATLNQTTDVKADDNFLTDVNIKMTGDPRRRVSRIMIFYSDNTYDNFIPE